jgi:uncharacterized protein DUF6799
MLNSRLISKENMKSRYLSGKKLIVLIAAFVFTGTVFAQDYNKTQSTTQTQQDKTKKDMDKAVVMKGGKVYDVREGKSILITSDITIGSSTVMPDGTVKMKDGTTAMLKDGDCVRADGTVKAGTDKMKEKDPGDKMENK